MDWILVAGKPPGLFTLIAVNRTLICRNILGNPHSDGNTTLFPTAVSLCAMPPLGWGYYLLIRENN